MLLQRKRWPLLLQYTSKIWYFRDKTLRKLLLCRSGDVRRERVTRFLSCPVGSLLLSRLPKRGTLAPAASRSSNTSPSLRRSGSGHLHSDLGHLRSGPAGRRRSGPVGLSIATSSRWIGIPSRD